MPAGAESIGSARDRGVRIVAGEQWSVASKSPAETAILSGAMTSALPMSLRSRRIPTDPVSTAFERILR